MSGADLRAVVLVEGVSDRAALETLAERQGRDLGAEGVAIVPIGGATKIGRHLGLWGRTGATLAGLCDAAEERAYRGGVERAGLGSDLDRTGMEALGFFVCQADLEDELIRALGTDAAERVIEAEGELGSFRKFQAQPAQRDRRVDQQLRRFLGTRSGRKAHYARSLVTALEPTDVPRPLQGVLARV